MREVYLAGGGFWALQRYFDCVAGVIDTEVGFVNGNVAHPSYREVCTGMTGFAEAVKVCYDEDILPLSGVLDLYFKAVDTIDFNEMQTQHRRGVYFIDFSDRELILDHIKKAQPLRLNPVAVEVGALKNYYPAEDYHQHYLEKHPSGYCNIGREAFTYAGAYRV